MIYLWLAVAAVSAALGFLGGQRWESSETQGWIEQAATLEAQLHQMQADGDARAKRSEAVAAKATADLAKVKKELEAERGRNVATTVDRWNGYLDAGRVRATPGDLEASLAACRADERAARGALRDVIGAAFAIREVAVLNTEQLRALQEWVREASK